MSTDLRKIAMLNSLRRFNIRQLNRIKNYSGKFNHNDKAYDESTGQYHYIAVAIGILEIKGFQPTEATVTRQLSFCRLSVKALPEIDDSNSSQKAFYTEPNHDRDLNIVVDELIAEKRLEETP